LKSKSINNSLKSGSHKTNVVQNEIYLRPTAKKANATDAVHLLHLRAGLFIKSIG